MPTFTGTSQEFKRHIGPRLRNFVQMLTRKHKASVGACEHCGAGQELESAHVRGTDRNQIIDLLPSAISTETVVTVELRQFEASLQVGARPSREGNTDPLPAMPRSTTQPSTRLRLVLSHSLRQ